MIYDCSRLDCRRRGSRTNEVFDDMLDVPVWVLVHHDTGSSPVICGKCAPLLKTTHGPGEDCSCKGGWTLSIAAIG